MQEYLSASGVRVTSGVLIRLLQTRRWMPDMLLVEVDPAFFDFQVSISSDMFALTSHPGLLWAVCISLSAFMRKA